MELFRSQYFNSQVKKFIIKFVNKHNNIGIIKTTNFIESINNQTTYTHNLNNTAQQREAGNLKKYCYTIFKSKGPYQEGHWLKNQI